MSAENIAVPADPQEQLLLARSLKMRSMETERAETYLQALQLYAKVLEVDPKNVEALQELASAALESGATDKAISYYERYLELQPNDAKAQTDYALALIQANASDRAAGVLEALLAREANLFPARLALAFAYRTLKRFDDARREAERAKTLAPDDTGREVVERFLAGLKEAE